MDFIFIRKLLKSSVDHESKKMNLLPAEIFQAAATDAFTALLNYQTSGEPFLRYMQEQAEASLKLLPWWKRFFFRYYVLFAFNIAEDIYLSFNKRFIKGGEGEGRCWPMVKL